jgi:hypothetical protein
MQSDFKLTGKDPALTIVIEPAQDLIEKIE